MMLNENTNNIDISMAQEKNAVAPLLTRWSYHILALSQSEIIYLYDLNRKTSPSAGVLQMW